MNLMGLYNCFSNRLLSDIALPITLSNNGSTKWYDSNPNNIQYNKITLFPIKIGETYNIRIFNNLNSSIVVQPAFYVNGKLRGIPYDESNNELLMFKPEYYNKNSFVYKLDLDQFVSSSVSTVVPYSVKKLRSSIKLYTADGSTTPSDKTPSSPLVMNNQIKTIINNQNILYLMVQIPTSDKELLISVIEQPHYVNPINISLLISNPGYNQPFSDKLIEYLLGNVITPIDEIPQNIERIQSILYSDGFQNEFVKNNNNIKNLMGDIKPGIFNEAMRKIIYYALHDKGISDFTGYIDKDVESYLNKYKG